MAVTAEQLAARLRAARESCGLTQEEVAHHLGVSRPTVAQMELGNRGITGVELERLARLYGRAMGDFFEEEFRPEDALLVLFRREASVVERDGALEAIRHCVDLGREMTNLERRIGIDRRVTPLPDSGLPAPRTRWEAIQHGERVASEERRRLGLGTAPLPNLAEVLEGQGVRAAQVAMPDDVSGLTIVTADTGALCVANGEHRHVRRRFSYAHEYCHVLLDRGRRATVSRAEERDSVLEVRANAFAAAFLMPAVGVQEFVEGLAKGQPSRSRADVFDEWEALRAEGRSEPGSQDIQLHDVVLLAHHFDVSRVSALYRLKNLKLVNESEFQALQDREAQVGRSMARLLGLEPDEEEQRREFKSRFLALGLEAYRREAISRRKLFELAGMVGVAPEEIEGVLDRGGLEDPAETPTTFPAEA
jgi:Zn-dependent peptidase ImmA (M78 family)/DNA-binding XRE family transcriptional regulator